MHDRRELNEDPGEMAASYASGFPADHSQTLPSFRELLPPHLHDEIEATSYLTSRQHSRERPVSSSRELPFNTRHYPASPCYSSSSREPSRSYPATSNRIEGSNSRGPSPTLPSIRDLQSLPERKLNPSSQGFSEGNSQPDRYPARGLPGGHFAPVNDRQNAGAYVGGSGAPSMHGQPAYSYPAVAYQNDPEPSSQIMPHAGIMGDPTDSKNKRRRGNLPKPVTDILRAWFHEHLDHPYPSEEDKQMFMTRTGLSISQISNWFINARRRQLPALRNQMRSGGSGLDSPQQSPVSDMEQD